MKVTTNLIERGKGSDGKLNKRQIQLLGLRSPLQTDWLRLVLGTWISPKSAEEFVAIKDKPVQAQTMKPRKRRYIERETSLDRLLDYAIDNDRS